MSIATRRCAAAAAAVVLTALCLTACSSGGSTGGGGSGGSKTVAALRIGDNSSQVLYDTAFEKQAKTYGWTVLPAQSANSSAGTQLSQIHRLVDQGVDGFIIDATDAHAVVPGLQYAESKGVKVVAIDNVPSSGPVYVGVSANNEDMAAKACDAIGKGTGGKGVVIAVEGAQEDSAGLGRKNGFTDCMSSKYSGMQVVQVYGKWDPATEASQLQTALTQYQQPAAIFLASDTAYLASVLQVLQGKGLTAKAGDPKHVYIATIDGTPEALDAIRSGVIDAAVSQPIPQTGTLGAQYLKDAFDGKTPKEGDTDHDSTLKSLNGYLVDELGADIVTKDNVDDKAFWANQS